MTIVGQRAIGTRGTRPYCTVPPIVGDVRRWSGWSPAVCSSVTCEGPAGRRGATLLLCAVYVASLYNVADGTRGGFSGGYSGSESHTNPYLGPVIRA